MLRITQKSRQREATQTSKNISHIYVEQFYRVECAHINAPTDQVGIFIWFTNTTLFFLSWCEKKLFSRLYFFLHIFFYTEFNRVFVPYFLSFIWGSKIFLSVCRQSSRLFSLKMFIQNSLLIAVLRRCFEHSIILVNDFTLYFRRFLSFHTFVRVDSTFHFDMMSEKC